MREATVSISPLLKSSIKQEMRDKTPNWRIHEKNFVGKSDRHVCEPGAVTFSAGWFAQGHVVRNSFKFILIIELIPNQSEVYELLPSYNLRMQRHLGSSDWVGLSNELEEFTNLALSLTHPNLFESGLLMLQRLRQLETTKEIAEEWQSVYTGIAIISNRMTPSHRDTKGRPEWFDTLTSYSDPSTRPRLLIEDVGLDLKYLSGTVVSFCGSILKHGVESWGDGDRVCYAHFMRESVRERLEVNPAGWLYRDRYLAGCNKERSDDGMDVD